MPGSCPHSTAPHADDVVPDTSGAGGTFVRVAVRVGPGPTIRPACRRERIGPDEGPSRPIRSAGAQAPASPGPRRTQAEASTMTDIPDGFDAFVAEKDGDGVRRGVRRLAPVDLPDGEVTIRVAWSGVNFKDALAATRAGTSPASRRWCPASTSSGRWRRAATPRSHRAIPWSPTGTRSASPATAGSRPAPVSRRAGSSRCRPASPCATPRRSGRPATRRPTASPRWRPAASHPATARSWSPVQVAGWAGWPSGSSSRTATRPGR